MKLNDMLRRYSREEAEKLCRLPHYRAKQVYRGHESLTWPELKLKLYEFDLRRRP